MKISMYLGRSKYWWTYLAIKSNPSILSMMTDGGFDRAIFFDDLDMIQRIETSTTKRHIKHFYIFWDGIGDETEIEKAKLLLGRGSDLTTLVVGDFSKVSQEKYKVQSLYAHSSLDFSASPPQFDIRTKAILLGTKLKIIAMPLKNILNNKGDTRKAIRLLFGRKKIVFCGSYGTIPKVFEQLCERRSINFRLFEQYHFYCNNPTPSFKSYRQYLRSDGLFLSDLYDRSKIDATFFSSAVHLLGREYFIEKIRSVGLDIFANGYNTGININVYTTPFYSQHVFIDFGSVVGTGNYPRLADLKYFKKNVVEIGMNERDIEELMVLARTGSLDRHFDNLWELNAPQIFRSMS
jgi:hypothetical protein